MARWDKISFRGKVIDKRKSTQGLMTGGGLIGIVSLGIFLFSVFSGGALTHSSLQQILAQINQIQGNVQAVNDQQFNGDDSYEVFSSKVLGSSNEVWRGIFQQSDKTYVEPQIVLFRSATQSACGFTTSAVGPHYCPDDSTIYIDETFFDQMTKILGAKNGDVGQAYVMAHEVGHHVQYLLGVLDNSKSDKDTSIAIELQADCYAGIWAKAVADQKVLEPNEIDEAISAAEAVGDDHIQKVIQGTVHPESWTHGSSAQRKTWFLAGYNSGSPIACNTYKNL